MARLTLSEQINAINAECARLHTDLAIANEALRAGQRQIDGLEAAHKTAIADLSAAHQKELAGKKSTYDYVQKHSDGYASELEQAHAVLDGVPGAPTREYEIEGNYGKTKRNVVTRLAGAFLAIAQKGGV